MHNDDRFFIAVGKTVCVLSITLTFVLAGICIALAVEALQESDRQPTFTIAPDSARRGK